MGPFEQDLKEIRRILDELDDSPSPSPYSIEACVDRLDDLARRVEGQSRALRDETALALTPTLPAGTTLPASGSALPVSRA